MEYQASKDTNQIELMKVQAIHGETTFVLVIPKDFTERLVFATFKHKCDVCESNR